MQSYIEVDLQDKLMVLFSFIRTNLQTKGIVFMSCCKQVGFCEGSGLVDHGA